MAGGQLYEPTFDVPIPDGLSEDFVELRKGDGARYERMLDRRVICGLDVVSRELIKSKRSENERHYVALDQTRCAAQDSEMLGHRYSTIVATTLDFPPTKSTLNERRELAIERLLLAPRGQTYKESRITNPITPDSSTYKSDESKAYRALAGYMAGLEESACTHPSEAQRRQQAKVDAQIASLQSQMAEIADFIKQLGSIAAGFREAQTEPELRKTSKRLLTHLPRGRAFAEVTWELTRDIDIVRLLGSGSISAYYPWWLTRTRLIANKKGIPELKPLAAASFEAHWDIATQASRRKSGSLIYEVDSSLHLSDKSEKFAESSRLRGARFDVFSARRSLAASYEILVRIFAALEFADDWESLEPPAGARLLSPDSTKPIAPQ